jgi:predicted ATP-dependent serine protease
MKNNIKQYVCADCGNQQDSMIGNCTECKSIRVILISIAKLHFGDDWKETCFPKNEYPNAWK